MNQLDLTGMLLCEAKEALALQGIHHFNIVVTAPPRVLDRTVRDDYRVLKVFWDKSPIELLVCS